MNTNRKVDCNLGFTWDRLDFDTRRHVRHNRIRLGNLKMEQRSNRPTCGEDYSRTRCIQPSPLITHCRRASTCTTQSRVCHMRTDVHRVPRRAGSHSVFVRSMDDPRKMLDACQEDRAQGGGRHTDGSQAEQLQSIFIGCTAVLCMESRMLEWRRVPDSACCHYSGKGKRVK